MPPTDKELILSILEATRPLPTPRGERLPLFLWPAQQLGTEDEKELESLLSELEARGISAIASWRPPDARALESALRLGRIQKLQKAMLAEPVLTHFPRALVGNYGVYPHEGYRYWYDYFEKFVEGAPHRMEGRARYRKWFDEFPLTGYTFAMPVLYPWYPVFGWYDFDNPDYRWFYNLLLEGSSAGKSTPAPIPLIPFVHWHTTEPPKNPDPRVKQLSRETYQELLWHLLLRGHDTFFLWSPRAEALEESRLVHEVYRASHEYRDFLRRGTPLTFEVPKLPGPVVSALRLGSRLLVRRTDFDARDEPVRLMVDGQNLEIPRAPGRSQLLERD
jgi:hypothetical protein